MLELPLRQKSIRAVVWRAHSLATAVKATAATLVKIPMEKVTPIAAGLTKTMPVPKVLVVLATASGDGER